LIYRTNKRGWINLLASDVVGRARNTLGEIFLFPKKHPKGFFNREKSFSRLERVQSGKLKKHIHACKLKKQTRLASTTVRDMF
jgi:hypothetical protein